MVNFQLKLAFKNRLHSYSIKPMAKVSFCRSFIGRPGRTKKAKKEGKKQKEGQRKTDWEAMKNEKRGKE